MVVLIANVCQDDNLRVRYLALRRSKGLLIR